jgi:AcrR family transcriptional regulator
MARIGRPRSFDRSVALQRAMETFWRLGYEGATLLDLQDAMGGISPPSFYAAFGSKEQLFREAVELYEQTEMASVATALLQTRPTKAAVDAMLHEAARAFTKRGKPAGCMLVLGATSCSASNQPIQEYIRSMRENAGRQIRRRLEQGVRDGDVPKSVALGGLTSFYTTVLHGMSIQAHDGASTKDLLGAADGAMAAWDALVQQSVKDVRRRPAQARART